MAIPLYLAMTAAEFRKSTVLPKYPAWLSCLFSPYGAGLSNIPTQLPVGSLLILSDRTPIYGHDPDLVKAQLEEAVQRLHCIGVLLDFQRPACEAAAAFVRKFTGLPFPVAVSPEHANAADHAIFLPPVPPGMPPEEYLLPWDGQEIWLETAMDGRIITLTGQGAAYHPLPVGEQPEGGHKDNVLHCHYAIHTAEDTAEFTLFRTREDTTELLEEAEKLGVKLAVGLYQEFGIL